VLCCHGNKTHAPIANPPNSAQLQGTPYHSPKLHLGPCSSVGMQPGTDRETHRRVWPIHILRRPQRTQNVIMNKNEVSAKQKLHRRQQQHNILNWQHTRHTHIVHLSCLPTVNSTLCRGVWSHTLLVIRPSARPNQLTDCSPWHWCGMCVCACVCQFWMLISAISDCHNNPTFRTCRYINKVNIYSGNDKKTLGTTETNPAAVEGCDIRQCRWGVSLR